MENFVPLTPINFIQIQTDCQYVEPGFPKISRRESRKFNLPDTSSLCHEISFADIALGWNHEGLEIYASISQGYQQSVYPNVSQGDSLELFFDTRDVKTAGFNTRFCHHFYFLPKEVDEQFAGEITTFRTEDTHELCSSADLKVISQFKKTEYSMQIFIPAHCLFGYDPDQFDRLGFAYRVNRAAGLAQHFCVLSDDYQIEQQSSLWSSLKLIR